MGDVRLCLTPRMSASLHSARGTDTGVVEKLRLRNRTRVDLGQIVVSHRAPSATIAFPPHDFAVRIERFQFRISIRHTANIMSPKTRLVSLRTRSAKAAGQNMESCAAKYQRVRPPIVSVLGPPG